MISRMRVIALVGAGAISSAAICSLYLAYTLDDAGGIFAGGSPESGGPENEESLMAAVDQETVPDEQPREGQAFLVAFLADADPQVRTLAAWGLMSGDDAEERQREILAFVEKERDPEVRIALYRFLHGQRSIKCATLVELVRQEKDHQTWLAGCDLLAGAVNMGAKPQTLEFFHGTIVPELKRSAVNGADLHSKIAAIIALRRAGTDEAVEALQEISETSRDEQVVEAAASAVRLAQANDH